MTPEPRLSAPSPQAAWEASRLRSEAWRRRELAQRSEALCVFPRTTDLKKGCSLCERKAGRPGLRKEPRLHNPALSGNSKPLTLLQRSESGLHQRCAHRSLADSRLHAELQKWTHFSATCSEAGWPSKNVHGVFNQKAQLSTPVNKQILCGAGGWVVGGRPVQ